MERTRLVSVSYTHLVQALKDYKVDVILINLPTGSHDAVRFYVDAACQAGCGIVNGIPELIASTPEIADKCKEAGVPVIGDDWKSQLGATIVHRALAKLFEDRGIKITKSYQLNYAGNTDFINLVMRGETKHVTCLLYTSQCHFIGNDRFFPAAFQKLYAAAGAGVTAVECNYYGTGGGKAHFPVD